MRQNVSIMFGYLTHIWCFVEVAAGQLFARESGFRHSRERIQCLAASGEKVGGDHSDARRVESPCNRRTRRTAAAKIGSNRPIQEFFKRFNIVIVVIKPYFSAAFRVPELMF